tara:strand:- start:53923 stop:54345 length:423 start_codon:yes stop_codon:yes gene_type:complete
MTILEIKTNGNDAQQALKDNGFKEISNWFNDNIYSKDGENYKIAHPVWTKDLKAVRVEKREIDISYSKDKMFTTFYSESKDGEEIWRNMAEKMNGVAKVFNFEASAVIKQIRNAGYIVKKSIKPTGTIDDILKELTIDES